MLVRKIYHTMNGDEISCENLIVLYLRFIKKKLMEDSNLWATYSFQNYIEDSIQHIVTDIELEDTL